MQFQDIQSGYRNGNVVMKVIYITVGVFALTFVMNTLSFLFQSDANYMIKWFALSPHFDALLFKPWTIITYGFLHEGFLHILFNLLILYYIGNLFLDFFNEKQWLVYYLSGILVGGAVFVLSYNYLPALKTTNALLVGASAGVTAILIGLATLIPDYSIRLMLIGNVPLKYIAILFVILDVIQIPDGNAGGHLAHLGGALTGFLLTNNFNQARGFNWDFSRLFKTKKQNPLKTVYKKESSFSRRANKTEHQQRVDHILEKISKSGYDVLTKEEKEFLFRSGKN